MSSLDRPFFAGLGASRIDRVDLRADGPRRLHGHLRLGSRRRSVRLRHAQFVILWGTNTRLTNRHLWPVVEEARAGGAEIVVIDPMRTVTAEAADWFVQPLTRHRQRAVLGMLHVLMRDDLVDHDYVDRYTTGFDELAAHVATWTPERVGAETGLDPSDVERLARAYGEAQPAFIRTLIGAEHTSTAHGSSARWAACRW